MNADFIRLIVGSSGKEALRELIEGAESQPISNYDFDVEWQDLTKPGGPTLTPDGTEHLGLLISLIDGTANYFHDCHWTLFRFSQRSLITSDHPVSLLVGPEHPHFEGIGIFNAELILVPLSRRLAMNIQPRDRLPEQHRDVADFEVPGATTYARAINQETATKARRYIYHHPSDNVTGLHLPPPSRQRAYSPASDHLIREEGIFGDLDNSELEALSRAGFPDTDGITIRDLPWPIPGRVSPPRRGKETH